MSRPTTWITGGPSRPSRRRFLEFATGIRDRDGFVVVCVDDPGGARLAERCREAGVDVRTYGESLEADYRLSDARRTDAGWAFDTVHNGVRLGEIALEVPGKHNALNALAAFVTGLGLDYSASDLRDGLASFSGTRRRFDFKGQVDDIRVFDDYAHHPTEIEATLRAARDVVGDGRVVVAFQAHHYYRTAMFVEEFGQALGLADEVVVLEVFAPGETPIPGASGQTMASHVPLPAAQVVFEPSWSAVAGHLVDRARPGDLIMTLGAGDIGMIGLEVLDLLRARQGRRMRAPTVDRPVTADLSDRRPRRRRRMRILGLVLAALVMAGVVWLVWFSSVLAVKQVRVVGVEDDRAQAVLRAATVPRGVPLATLDTEAARRAVLGLDWVESADVRRGWPNEIVVAVTARVPIAVLAGANDGAAVDATGRVFSPEGNWAKGLPTVRAQDVGLEAAMSVLSALPADLAAPGGVAVRDHARRRQPDPAVRRHRPVGERRPGRVQGSSAPGHHEAQGRCVRRVGARAADDLPLPLARPERTTAPGVTAIAAAAGVSALAGPARRGCRASGPNPRRNPRLRRRFRPSLA